jgi:transposase-like protein
MKKKKRYTLEEKTIILREHIEEHLSVSETAEKYGLHPNAIYQWKKAMYETASVNTTKQTKQTEKKQSQLLKEIETLKATLSMRESLIAELVEDNIRLKKKSLGEILLNNGLNRR